MLKDKKVVFLTILFTLTEIINFNITFIIIFGLIIFYILKNNSCIIYKNELTKNLFFILLIGIASGIVGCIKYSYEYKDFLRDIYLMFKPIVYVSFGLFLKNKSYCEKNIFAAIVYSGFFISIRHIFLLLINFGSDPRGIGGNESFITLIAILILLCYEKKDEIIKIKQIRIFFILFMTISAILYISRTCLAVAIVFYFVNFVINIEKTYKKVLKHFFIIVIIMIIGYKIIPVDITNKFMLELSRSFIEISSNNKEWNFYNINADWRGYEVYRTKIAFKDASITEKLFGYGDGKLLDLNINITLKDKEYTKIAVLHNGYYYLLLKTGILGVSIYLFIFLKIAFNYLIISKKTNLFKNKLVSSIAFSNLITTYIITGIYNNSNAVIFCVLLGYFIDCKKNEIENSKKV